jgi:Na+-transporting NADH:ubiquinone oxidoreductase subunit B
VSLRSFLDKQEKKFKEGKLKKYYALFEATDTFLYTTNETAKSPSFVRDAIDLKRTMITVFIALLPAVFMAFYNTGYQALLASGGESPGTWQAGVLAWLGLPFDAHCFWSDFILGALHFLPIYLVTLAVGGFWETLFAIVRGHEINEGFLVTSLLFPMIVPATMPLWQVAVGISFGVVFGKEVFGGVGMNVLNPALTGRAFLFFAYPAQISGDKIWVAVDGLSKATPLAKFAESGMNGLQQANVSWSDAFFGLIPGSMGETSTLAILIGAVILIVTGIASWRIMLSIVVGMVAMSLTFNLIGSDTNPMFAMSPAWHFVLGGFALGTVFMATDPVTAAVTKQGQVIYGLLIGVLVVLVRVVNPAFPEGMMLAILFGNVFAPIIDKIFINANIKRRQLRNVV